MASTLRAVGHEDRLSLIEHLTELRTRLIICLVAFIGCTAVCMWQNQRVLDILNDPLTSTQKASSKDPIQAGTLYNQLIAQYTRQSSATFRRLAAVIDDPQNPLLLLLLGQALFATSHFDEAAGATQAAMQMAPKEHWGVVVKNFRELYGNPRDYTTHLRALEKAEAEKPNDPAMRFLAGFHYAYLGYPVESIDQLDKGLKFAPRDEMAKQLRDEMQTKLPKPTGEVTIPATPATP